MLGSCANFTGDRYLDTVTPLFVVVAVKTSVLMLKLVPSVLTV